MSIVVRIKRLQEGLPGDVRDVGDGIFELRIAYGPGYRLYATRIERKVVLLLCGGDKGSQARDIKKARRLNEKARKGVDGE